MLLRLARLLAPICLVVALAGCAGPGTVQSGLARIAQEPSGTMLVGKGGDLWVVESGKPRQFTTGGTWRQPRWSPDGTRFAYVFREQNFSEIFVQNRDGSDPVRLTSSQSPILQDSDWAFSPDWSPDGEKIAFTSDHASYNPMLWVMNADGSGKRQVITADYGLDAVETPAWSPDGSTILFTGFKQGTSQIYRFDRESLAVSPLTATSEGAFDPAWSPDGRLVAYAAREQGQTTIHVISADGSRDAKVAEARPARSPAWSPDGKSLAFLSSVSGQFEVMLVTINADAVPLNGSDERQITSDLNADAASGISWAPQ